MRRLGRTSISVLHSFFEWANRRRSSRRRSVAKIRRPRSASRHYRPSIEELRGSGLRRATRAAGHRADGGRGLRSAEILGADGPTSTWSAVGYVCSARAELACAATRSRCSPGAARAFECLSRSSTTTSSRSRLSSGCRRTTRTQAEEPEEPCKRAGVLADGSARLHTRPGIREVSPAPLAARLCESLPPRERSRRRRAQATAGSLADRHNAALHDEIEVDELAAALMVLTLAGMHKRRQI